MEVCTVKSDLLAIDRCKIANAFGFVKTIHQMVWSFSSFGKELDIPFLIKLSSGLEF